MADNIATTPGSGATIAADDVGGVLHQRVKLGLGADGTAVDVQPPTGGGAGGQTVNTIMAVGLMLEDLNLSSKGTWARVATRDGEGNLLGAAGMVYNGASFDRERGNTEGTLLASAARTTTTVSSNQTNYNGRGVFVWLEISAGTGFSLQPVIEGINPTGGPGSGLTNLNATPTAVTATGLYCYELYPGASTAAPGSGTNLVVQRTAAALPRTWRIEVLHGNANSVTYSVGYSLVV